MDQRERFEAHMRSRGETYLYRRDVPGSERFGQYCLQSMQREWESWQAAEAAVTQWQPIETAPRDGSPVLLMATRHSMMMPHPEMIVGAYRQGWWSGPSTLSHVTHWMPLPAAPVERGGDKS